jgi:hypothetical protein
MPEAKALEIMAANIGTTINAECFAALRSTLARRELNLSGAAAALA